MRGFFCIDVFGIKLWWGIKWREILREAGGVRLRMVILGEKDSLS